MNRYLPLIVFLVLIGFLGVGLSLKPREVPSPLIDKPAPNFRLPTLAAPANFVSTQDLLGKVWILNVWASWCVACQLEHPVVMELARKNIVPVYGLNYKDKNDSATRWLVKYGGDPYVQSLVDSDGLVGIEFGVYGVPETFVIDRQGVIRHKHIGPLTSAVLRDTIYPLVAKLNR